MSKFAELIKSKIQLENGTRHDIIIPVSASVKQQAKEDGAKWDSVKNTHYFISDDDTHPLHKLKRDKYLKVTFEESIPYETRKVVQSEIKNNTTMYANHKVINKEKDIEEWEMLILITDDNSDMVIGLGELGFISE